MNSGNLKNKIKNIVDNFLLVNLFLVILCGIFFLFAVIMDLKEYPLFLDLFRKYWDPFIISLISILIISSLSNAFISWLRRKVLLEDEDI